MLNCWLVSVAVLLPTLIIAYEPDEMKYTKCFDAQAGEQRDCPADNCVQAELAAEGVSAQPVCFCAQWNKGASCAADLDTMNEQPTRFGWDPAKFSDEGFNTNIVADAKAAGKGKWSPDITDYTYKYPVKDLLGVYLVNSLDDCKQLCEKYNPDGLSYDPCGAVVYHEADNHKICEAVGSKPIRLCEKWLKKSKGWTVSYLFPRTVRYGCN